jgi:hypothetical protein
LGVSGKVETCFWGIIAVFLKLPLKNLIRLEKWHKIHKLGCNYGSILTNPTLKLERGCPVVTLMEVSMYLIINLRIIYHGYESKGMRNGNN